MDGCTYVVFGCMSYKVQRITRKLRRSLGISEKDCDYISVAGGAGNLEQVQMHLGLSRKLHTSSIAILTIHEKCGAGAKESDLYQAGKIAREIGFTPRLFVITENGRWRELS